MKYIWLSYPVVFALAAALIFFGGVRVIVIQPIGAIPDGATVIISGIENVNLIDSPDAICMRHEGGVSLWCRGREIGALGRNGKIVFKLPYSSILFKLTGAPDLNR